MLPFLRNSALLFALALTSAPAFAQFCAPANAPRAFIKPGAGVNLRGPVHPNAVGALRCVVQRLESIGLPVKTLWGYGCRPASYSLHPRGLAVDVNQFARNRTNPVVPRDQGISIAQACGAVSGGQWVHQPDNGHFEVHSLSRVEQVQQRPPSAPVYPHYLSLFDLILHFFGLK